MKFSVFGGGIATQAALDDLLELGSLCISSAILLGDWKRVNFIANANYPHDDAVAHDSMLM
jgi:hypothetical protein